MKLVEIWSGRGGWAIALSAFVAACAHVACCELDGTLPDPQFMQTMVLWVTAGMAAVQLSIKCRRKRREAREEELRGLLDAVVLEAACRLRCENGHRPAVLYESKEGS